ncbi:MAG: nitroreductase family protein [Promethearchaeota archaeon]|jgi:nitroreductase
MEFYEVIKTRRSYRVFKADKPEEEKVERILNAARLAPTWANMQGVHYIVIGEPEKVKAVWEAVGQAQKFAQAPMFIVAVISERGSGTNSNGQKYYGVDVGICFEHLILAATAEGLGTCWIGWFNEDKVKSVLNIPEDYIVMGITPLGYPVKPKSEITERKPLDKIVHYENF